MQNRLDDRMVVRTAVLVFGIIYLLWGVLGLISAFYTHPPANAPHLVANGGYGYLFGIFPVNTFGNVVNILVGLFGILAGARYGLAVGYARFFALILAIVMVLGFVPEADTFYGYIPVFSPNTWVHVISAAYLAFAGFVLSAPTYEAPEGSAEPAHA